MRGKPGVGLKDLGRTTRCGSQCLGGQIATISVALPTRPYDNRHGRTTSKKKTPRPVTGLNFHRFRTTDKVTARATVANSNKDFA